MLQATTTNFGAFFALRFLMGMFESCVAPILILIITMFYKHDEQVGDFPYVTHQKATTVVPRGDGYRGFTSVTVLLKYSDVREQFKSSTAQAFIMLISIPCIWNFLH